VEKQSDMATTKVKKEDVEMEDTKEGNSLTYEEKAANASIIACPMASKKLAKRIYKLMKKASKQKLYLRSGLKLVQSRIRRGEDGIVIFAGNASPIEVICHLPVVCEDKKIPYVYVPTGKDLGAAIGAKRCTLVVLIRSHPDYKELFDELHEEIKCLDTNVG